MTPCYPYYTAKRQEKTPELVKCRIDNLAIRGVPREPKGRVSMVGHRVVDSLHQG